LPSSSSAAVVAASRPQQTPEVTRRKPLSLGLAMTTSSHAAHRVAAVTRVMDAAAPGQTANGARSAVGSLCRATMEQGVVIRTVE